MKIGIISLPLNANYGGILQAYALQTILRKQGHEVEHLEIRHKRLEVPCFPKSIFIYGKRITKILLGKWRKPFFWEKYVNEVEESICLQNTSQFISNFIHIREINSFSDIDKNDYDCFIVGSDQVWRPKYFRPIKHAFLDFAQNWDVKRISYAPSFGVDECEYTDTDLEECSHLLAKFIIVTVRENSGVEICKRYFGICCNKVIDPTMLLNYTHYESLVSNTPTSSGDIMIYVLDTSEAKDNLVCQIAKSVGGKTFSVGSKYSNLNAPIESRIQPPVEKWLAGFRDAKFVITDSFHACVFSIIFNKPFVVIGNKERGMSRFESLLVDFDLTNRLIADINDFMKIDEIMRLPNNVGQILTAKRVESIKYLSF